MKTEDLTSYYSGYDEYLEREAKVPFEDYRNLEDKIEIYERALEELKELIEDEEQYKTMEKINLSKAILLDVKRDLELI